MGKIMRRTIAIIMLAIITTSFVACGKKEDKTSNVQGNKQESESKKENESDGGFLYEILEDEQYSSYIWHNYNDGVENSYSIALFNEKGMMYSWHNVAVSLEAAMDDVLEHGWECKLDKYGNSILTRKYEIGKDGFLNHYIADESKHEYNEKGLLVKTSIENHDMASETIEYTYDENDNIIKRVYTKGSYVSTTTYEYDENNNCVKETSNDGVSGELVKIRKFDSEGNLLEEGDLVETKVKNKYDENGRLIESIEFNGVTRIEYDKYGNKLKEVHTSNDPTIGESVYEYEYEGTNKNFIVTVNASHNSTNVYTYENSKLIVEQYFLNDKLLRMIEYNYDNTETDKKSILDDEYNLVDVAEYWR